MRNWLWIAVIVSCILVGILGAISHYKQEANNSVRSPSSGVIHHQSAAILPQKILNTDSKPIREALVAPALAAELAQANNLLAFIESAKNRPLEGGWYYASKLSNECEIYNRSTIAFDQEKDVPYSAAESHAVAVKRQRARETLSALCRGITREIENEHRSRHPTSTEKIQQSPDPLIKLSRSQMSFHSGTDNQTPQEAINRFFDKPDPLLVYQQPLTLFRKNNKDPENYAFGDKNYTEIEAHAAAKLLACDLGYVCNERNLDVLQTCSQGGSCYESYQQLVNTIVPAKNMVVINQLRQALYEAIQQRNATPFLVSVTPR
jgi:hypothetical protein